MKTKFDIIAIGDATMDTFLRLEEAVLIPSKEEHNAMICLAYADKIPVKHLHRKIAGNAANNAVGAARLGLRSALYSIIGDDDGGREILQGLKKEKVSTKYLHIDKKSETNFTAVLNYNGERTQLIYHVERQYKLPILDSTQWIYYTEIGDNHVSLEKDIINYIKKSGAKLGFNPGTSQLSRGVNALQGVLDIATVLFVNKEEGYKLVGRHEMPDLLKELHELGPKIVVVTDGSKGACAYDGRDSYCMNVFPVKVVEMTGAGDAFATGFICALNYGLDIYNALLWGTANSTSVISFIGPQDGLLKKTEIEKMIRKHSKIKPERVA